MTSMTGLIFLKSLSTSTSSTNPTSVRLLNSTRTRHPTSTFWSQEYVKVLRRRLYSTYTLISMHLL